MLSRLISERGAPLHLRSDNGPEFVSRALLKWIVDRGIDTALIDPGKPWQNGAAESLNGKFRDECQSLEWFRSRAEAKVVIESWRRHYNEVRPHSSLGYLTPAAFAAKIRQHDAAPAQATGRSAAVSGASALRPVAQPPRKGQSKAATRVVVSSRRGPKKPGRSHTPSPPFLAERFCRTFRTVSRGTVKRASAGGADRVLDKEYKRVVHMASTRWS